MILLMFFLGLHEHHGVVAQSNPVAPSLKQRVESHPDDHLAWARYGRALLGAAQATGSHDDFRHAQGAFEKALELVPSYRGARHGLIRSLSGRHEFNRALDEARSLALNPDPPLEDLVVMGDVHLALGHLTEAHALFLRLDEGPDAWMRLAQVHLELGDIERAQPYLDRSIETLDRTDQRRVWCQTALAVGWIEQDQARAERALRGVIATSDAANWAQFELAKLLIRTGQATEAASILTLMLERQSRPDVQLSLVRAWYVMGNTTAAKALQHSVVDQIRDQVRHGDWGHSRVLAEFWLDQRTNLGEAVKWLRHEYNQVRMDPQGIELLGWGLHLLDDHRSACKVIQPLLSCHQSTRFLLRSGVILAAADRRVPARHLLARALAANATNYPELAQQARAELERPLSWSPR